MKFIVGETYIVKEKKTKEIMNLRLVAQDSDYFLFNFIKREIPYKSADIIIAKENKKNFTFKKMGDEDDLADKLKKLKVKPSLAHDFQKMKLT